MGGYRPAAAAGGASAPTAHASTHESGGSDATTKLVAQATPDTTQQNLNTAGGQKDFDPTVTFTADGASDYILESRFSLWISPTDTADLYYRVDSGADVLCGRNSQVDQHQVMWVTSTIIPAASLSAGAHTITVSLDCARDVRVYGTVLPTLLDIHQA